MKIQAMSDLHFEFHADSGKDFIKSLDPKGIDVLVVAGDLAVNPGLYEALVRICAVYPKVVYVHGNHEFYRSNRPQVLQTMRCGEKEIANLIWLDNRVVEIDGVTFAGTPLWFPYSPFNVLHENELADFEEIANYRCWVYEENDKAVSFLNKKAKVDVVVTHHLPTNKSVSPQYQDSRLNCFFVCDVEAVMYKYEPKLWIHGHTHTSFDYNIHNTRVVCNPFGYAAFAENREYKEKLVVEV